MDEQGSNCAAPAELLREYIRLTELCSVQFVFARLTALYPVALRALPFGSVQSCWKSGRRLPGRGGIKA